MLKATFKWLVSPTKIFKRKLRRYATGNVYCSKFIY